MTFHLFLPWANEEGELQLRKEALQSNAIEKRDPCVIATTCTIETVIEDPLLPVLKEDSNITKSAGQIRRPCLDYNPASPRFKLFVVDLVPYPKVGVLFNIRFYFRRTLRPSLRKKFIQAFSPKRKYISFTPFPQARLHRPLPEES